MTVTFVDTATGVQVWLEHDGAVLLLASGRTRELARQAAMTTVGHLAAELLMLERAA